MPACQPDISGAGKMKNWLFVTIILMTSPEI